MRARIYRSPDASAASLAGFIERLGDDAKHAETTVVVDARVPVTMAVIVIDGEGAA